MTPFQKSKTKEKMRKKNNNRIAKDEAFFFSTENFHRNQTNLSRTNRASACVKEGAEGGHLRSRTFPYPAPVLGACSPSAVALVSLTLLVQNPRRLYAVRATLTGYLMADCISDCVAQRVDHL